MGTDGHEVEIAESLHISLICHRVHAVMPSILFCHLPSLGRKNFGAGEDVGVERVVALAVSGFFLRRCP